MAWAVLVLLPSLLTISFSQCQSAQRFRVARAVARLIRLLHPWDGWREMPEIMRALDLARSGHETEALRILRRYQSLDNPTGLMAASQVHRLTSRWEDLMEWRREYLTEPVLARLPGFIAVVLRAFGETGDLNGMLAWYEQFERRIEGLPPLFAPNAGLAFSPSPGGASRCRSSWLDPCPACLASTRNSDRHGRSGGGVGRGS